MVLQTSGTICLDDLVTEFGGTAPHCLSEYYRGGGLVPDTATNAGIPSSGTLCMDDFYGGDVVSGPPSGQLYTMGIDGQYQGKYGYYEQVGLTLTGLTGATSAADHDANGGIRTSPMLAYGLSSYTDWECVGDQIGTVYSSSGRRWLAYGSPNQSTTQATVAVADTNVGSLYRITGTDIEYYGSSGEAMCMVRSDGRAWAIGSRSVYGGGSDPTGTAYPGPFQGPNYNLTSPVQLAGSATNWKNARYGGLGTRTDGKLWVWGINGTTLIGSIGGVNGNSNFSTYSTPVQLTSGTDWDTLPNIQLEGIVATALKTDGKLWHWGRTAALMGQGYAVPNNGNIYQEPIVKYSSPVNEITASAWEEADGLLGVKTDGRLWAFSSGVYGRNGPGTTNKALMHSTPVQVYGGATNWAVRNRAARGGQRNFTLYHKWTRTDGRAWFWGGEDTNFAHRVQASINGTQTQTHLNWATGQLTASTSTSPLYSTPQQYIGSRTDWIDVGSVSFCTHWFIR